MPGLWWAVLLFVVVFTIWRSFYSIGPTEVGLVRKRFGKKLPDDNPVAFHGEAGYQAELLMPGLRFKLLPVYAVTKHPWVQVSAGEIGVVIAQVGRPLPIGAKSAIYKKEFGTFADLGAFVRTGGQKGVQRPVLSPGTLAPVHPIGFLVITKPRVYGMPVLDDFRGKKGALTFASFGLTPEQLEVTRIEPKATESGRVLDMVGIVTALEGDPLPAGDIASRLGGFEDIKVLEDASRASAVPVTNGALIETILGSKNNQHASYQDFQTFLERGGSIGLQHDPLLYGAYNLNPFLLRVEKVPMLVVEQGQVAVIKLVRGPAHRGYVRIRFQVRELGQAGASGHLGGAAADGQVPDQPPHLSGRDRADRDPEPQLVAGLVAGAQPRQGAGPHHGEEPGGIRLQHRPSGSHPRARHEGPARHLDGRLDDEPRERGPAGRRRQPVPRQARRDEGDPVHRNATGRAAGSLRTHLQAARQVPRWKPRASTSRMSSCRPNWSRC